MISDPTTRFTERVDDYVRARPRYPQAVVELLAEETGLTAEALIADIGSGPGLSAEPFLRNGNRVIGVEPNEAMRAGGEELIRHFPHFHYVPGTAEETGLPPASVDYIVCGQAFHWFDAKLSRAEFVRILAPGGWLVLMWNTRRLDSPFMQAYEQLLESFGTDFREVDHRQARGLARSAHEIPAAIGAFYGRPVELRVLANEQRFDLAGATARLLSSSYAPAAGHPAHEPMLRQLRKIFQEHQSGGEVVFAYDLEVYFGHLT